MHNLYMRQWNFKKCSYIKKVLFDKWYSIFLKKPWRTRCCHLTGHASSPRRRTRTTMGTAASGSGGVERSARPRVTPTRRARTVWPPGAGRAAHRSASGVRAYWRWVGVWVYRGFMALLLGRDRGGAYRFALGILIFLKETHL